MKETTNLVFNYKLQKDKVRESRNKIYPNKHFGTSLYPTCLFYKNITRLFLPIESNEK
jgi:hypothetical protein